MDERVDRLLRRNGWTPGAVLGAGMEGTVVELSDDEVAKIWHGRSRDDLDALVRFGSALRRVSAPFVVPSVLDLIEDGELIITVERRVHGRPLRLDRDPAPPVVTPDGVRLMGDVLAGLAQIAGTADLAALPILPGDQPLTWPAPFGTALAELVERRFRAAPDLLRRDVDQADDLVSALVAGLEALPADEPPVLIHGDLIPANVQVHQGEVSGVLDFGFLTTVGDPQFEAAVAASIFDMYGPDARTSETILTQAFLDRFDHDPARYDLYRAAYAVITNAYFGQGETDGHFRWCAELLRRPEVRAAVLN
ncbi:aminoglycoside phosphotransferase family protein [Microlunatus sp. GCM10028923]|uniref:aminoglycoside phosphotransferase family protein n=1 Tax=Microlunatus sp. GCM10028923 TaxID=3273400 RepID=UPI003614DC55